MVSGAPDDDILSDGMTRVVSVAIVVAIAAVTISLFVGAAAQAGSGGPRTSDEQAYEIGGGDVTLDGTNVSVVDVHQSLNDSAALDGSGAITGSLGDDVGDTRTVSTWAQVDNTSGTRQVVSVDSRTILVYNGSAAEWACWSYDDASGDTHRVAVNATSPGSFTNLQCERDSGGLTLRKNDTGATASVQTDAANATGETLQTTPLNGSVDETRVFNGTLTSAERSALYSSPTAPLESAPRQSRIMYDSYGSLDTIPVYFAGGSLDGTSAAKAAGLQGQGAVEGSDWSITDDVLSVLAGGTLEGAPVVFVAWLFGDGGVISITALTGGFGAMLRLAALVPLALVAKRLLGIELT